MIVQSRSEGNEVFVMWFLYFLSLILVWINYHYQVSQINLYQFSFLFIANSLAKIINTIFLIINAILINIIFTNKDRRLYGYYPMFVYLLVHNKWWLFENINYYLVSDFIILISLYFIRPQETKKKLNLLIFYFAAFFGAGFLIGINFFYSFIVPVFIFNVFLLSDWKSWGIFLLGLLMPLYFFVTISLFVEHDAMLFLKILIHHSFYKLGQFSLKDFSFAGELQWANIGIAIVLILLMLSGLQEFKDANFYSTKDRRIAIFFFFLMFFSLINFSLIYFFYHQHAFSVIALPYAYYLGGFLNKTSIQSRYFILFLIEILTVFL